MKHVTTVTKASPAKANVIEDIQDKLSGLLEDIKGIFDGGSN